VYIILGTLSYNSEIETVTMRDKSIIIENLTPIFTDEEAFTNRRSIEEGLFDIFEKYVELP